MTLQELLKNKKEAIVELAGKYGASNIRVFGSVARGDETPASDIDLLVDMDSDSSLFDQIALQEEIEILLGRKIDLVTEDSIYWLIRRRVLKEAIPL
ncbi:MAG: nucleotidyltransferase family protein [Acidobacteriota bacterium]|nr:MAG: nucleotidyltransferase family protein [Acidobacteriota bacterium]